MAQFKRDQKIICLSPFTTVHIFSELRSHEVHRKGRDFGSLYMYMNIKQTDCSGFRLHFFYFLENNVTVLLTLKISAVSVRSTSGSYVQHTQQSLVINLYLLQGSNKNLNRTTITKSQFIIQKTQHPHFILSGNPKTWNKLNNNINNNNVRDINFIHQ